MDKEMFKDLEGKLVEIRCVSSWAVEVGSRSHYSLSEYFGRLVKVGEDSLLLNPGIHYLMPIHDAGDAKNQKENSKKLAKAFESGQPMIVNWSNMHSIEPSAYTAEELSLKSKEAAK